MEYHIFAWFLIWCQKLHWKNIKPVFLNHLTFWKGSISYIRFVFYVTRKNYHTWCLPFQNTEYNYSKRLLKLFVPQQLTVSSFFVNLNFQFFTVAFLVKKISTLWGKKLSVKRRVLKAPKVVKTVLGELRKQFSETFWVSTILGLYA